MSAVGMIILINVVLFLANGLLTGDKDMLTRLLLLTSDTLVQPWNWWKFLTYGFAHDPSGFQHIFFNMLALYLMGPLLEQRMGKAEFLRFFLATIVFGGLVFAIINQIQQRPAACLGASGGVASMVILLAFYYPRIQVLFMFIIPMPLWVLGVLMVLLDVYGQMGNGERRIGYDVHLAGAFFAFIYYYNGWNLGRMIQAINIFSGSKRRSPQNRSSSSSNTRLKIFRVDERGNELPEKPKTQADLEFEKKLDEVLDRYSKVGEAGLTPEERRFWKEAGHRYQNKK